MVAYAAVAVATPEAVGLALAIPALAVGRRALARVETRGEDGAETHGEDGAETHGEGGVKTHGEDGAGRRGGGVKTRDGADGARS